MADRPIADVLREAGLRRTTARESVLEVIGDVGAPVTHAHLAAHPALARMDPVTLYRTLSALDEAGLVHSVHGIDGTCRYCPQPEDHPGCPGNHAHFLCTRCGAMRCLLDQPMPRVAVGKKASVQGRLFLAWGVCETCAGEAI